MPDALAKKTAGTSAAVLVAVAAGVWTAMNGAVSTSSEEDPTTLVLTATYDATQVGSGRVRYLVSYHGNMVDLSHGQIPRLEPTMHAKELTGYARNGWVVTIGPYDGTPADIFAKYHNDVHPDDRAKAVIKCSVVDPKTGRVIQEDSSAHRKWDDGAMCGNPPVPPPVKKK